MSVRARLFMAIQEKVVKAVLRSANATTRAFTATRREVTEIRRSSESAIERASKKVEDALIQNQ
jgi:hypothetical protein